MEIKRDGHWFYQGTPDWPHGAGETLASILIRLKMTISS